MSLKELLTDYFPHITLLLTLLGGIVSYFVKRYFDLKTKKTEINLGLLQQRKLEVLQNFIFALTESNLVWFELNIEVIFGIDGDSEHEMKKVNKVIKALQTCQTELILFLNEDDSKHLLKIIDNIDDLAILLLNLYKNDLKKDIKTRMTEYSQKRMETNDKNFELLKKVQPNVKLIFK